MGKEHLIRNNAEGMAKARATRRQNIVEGIKRYKVIADCYEELWQELAIQFKVRLPQRHVEPTFTHMNKWLKRLNISKQEYLEYSGYNSVRDFSKLNPTWNLRSFVGLLLEYKVMNLAPESVDS